jgi:hypothetical protein
VRSCRGPCRRQEETAADEEPFDAFALVGIERLLEGPQRAAPASEAACPVDLASEPPAILSEERVQRRLSVSAPEGTEQRRDDRQPRLRHRRDVEGPALIRTVEPAANPTVRDAVDPRHARQPVAGTRQWADGIPAERRRPRKWLPAGILEAASPRAQVFKHGEQVLAQAERAPDEIGAVTAAVDGLDAAEQRAVRGR